MHQRILVICALIFFSYINCFGQDTKHHNDLLDYQLKGKVKSLRSIPYHPVSRNGKIKKGVLYDELSIIVQYNIQLRFDEYGNLTRYGCTFGGRTMFTNNTYDSKHNLIESVSKIAAFAPKTLYFYDSLGNRIEERRLKSDGTIFSKNIFKYDKDGYKITDYFEDDDGKGYFKHIYKYNEKGLCIQEKDFGQDGRFTEKKVSEYNNQSQLIRASLFDSAGILQKKWIFEYDTTGNVSKDIMQDFRLNPMKVQIFYSKSDKQESEIFPKGKQDVIIKLNNKPQSIEVRTYQYKFDEQGNWIEEIDFINGKPEMIVERKIKYYS